MKIRIKIQGALIFLAIAAIFFLRKYLVPRWKSGFAEESMDISGMIVFLFGFLIRITARGYKEDNTFSGHALVKGGLYGITRNPMYFGTFMIGAGAILVLSNLLAFFIFVIIFLFIYWPQIKIEENILSARFGREYEEYCEKTPRLFPSARNLLPAGRYISLKPFWIKKELSSFAASFIAIAAIEIWEDTVIFGRSAFFTELAEFTLIAVIAALFIAHKAGKTNGLFIRTRK